MGSTQAFSSSAHRLPAISASDALKQLRDSGSQTIPTGISDLDAILVGSAIDVYGRGGVVRGQLTELFGPPGSGKTALSIQLARNAIKEGYGVVWIDCAQRLHQSRLFDGLDHSNKNSGTKFHSYYAPTTAHLLALVHRPTSTFPPLDTRLMVIDDVSTLFPPQYVKKAQKNTATPKPVGSLLQLAILNALNRIASAQNVAVVVLSHVSTRIRYNARAFLVPAQDGREWDDGFTSRIGLFRDFAPAFERYQVKDAAEKQLLARLRYAGIVKASGMSGIAEEGFCDIVPFGLTAEGKCASISFSWDQIPPNIRSSPIKSRKRGFDEIPDKEDDWSDNLDDYSWDEDEVQVLHAQPVEQKAKKAKAGSNEDEAEKAPGE